MAPLVLLVSRKTSFVDHVLENMLLIRKRRGPLKSSATYNHSREGPGRLPRSKDNQDNMLQQNNSGKCVTNSSQQKCFFPKCATSVPESFRSPRSQAKSTFTAHRGALHLLTLLFYRHSPPTLFYYQKSSDGNNTAVLQAK